jgi:hypothetical protein
VSAPALRPTARVRPVLRERLERQRGAHGWAAVVLAIIAIHLRLDSDHVTYSAAVVCVLLGGLLLPLLQATGPRDQPAWDAVLPVAPTRYALIRLVCGLAGAAFLLAVAAGLYAALFRNPAHPDWYPLALFTWGLSAYLLSSAALIATGVRGGYVLSPALCLLFVPFLPALLQDPAEFGPMGMTAVLARTVLPLGLVGAAAYAAARFQARAPAPADPAVRRAPAPRRDSVPALTDRPAPLPVRRAGPARPSATLTVFRRHFALLRRFAIVPALTLLVFACVVLVQSIAGTPEAGEGLAVRWFVESTGLRRLCVWMAISWTVLVWLCEHSAQRRWNDTLPVGTGKRRVLHAGAGAAWLLLALMAMVAAPLGAAVAAGTLASPADVPTWLWLGLPVRTLTLYLAATLVFFCTRLVFQVTPSVVPYMGPGLVLRVLPVRIALPFTMAVMMLALLVVPTVFFMWAIGHLEKLVLVVAGDADPHGWSYAASALWLVVHAAAAAGAIALNDWIRRAGRRPTLHEVRGFLDRWVGRRPGPPLPGHAAP